MGTHPIFESDFDCLTEMEEELIEAGVKIPCNSQGYPLVDITQEEKQMLETTQEVSQSEEETEDNVWGSWLAKAQKNERKNRIMQPAKIRKKTLNQFHKEQEEKEMLKIIKKFEENDSSDDSSDTTKINS